MSGREWAWLPKLALDNILHKLQYLPDCVRFASVCTAWRSIAQKTTNKQFSVPMLLIPTSNSNDKEALYNVGDNKTYYINFPSSPQKTRFCGSSHGWLITVQNDLSITLFSPTPKHASNTIHLPPIMDISQVIVSQIQDRDYPKICQHSVRKVILSGDPNSSDAYTVVAIYGWAHNLAVFRSGHQSWTYLDMSIRSVYDAFWHKEELYAVTSGGGVIHIHGVSSGNLSPRTVYPSNPGRKYSDRPYLIESTRGELMLVERYFDLIKEDRHGSFYTTIDFKVHKLEPSKVGLYKKREVKELGGDALFLGDNYSIAVAASDQMCSKNCIYYINDMTNVLATLYHYRVSSDMGIFCLENGEFKTHYIADPSLRIQPPVWITPVLSDGWV